MSDYINEAQERGVEIPDTIVVEDEEVSVMDAEENKRDDEYGIGVEIVHDAAPLVHKETGEFYGYIPKKHTTKTLFNPMNKSSKESAWMGYEEAWETIMEEYEWESPESYVDEDELEGEVFVRVVPFNRVDIALSDNN